MCGLGVVGRGEAEMPWEERKASTERSEDTLEGAGESIIIKTGGKGGGCSGRGKGGGEKGCEMV